MTDEKLNVGDWVYHIAKDEKIGEEGRIVKVYPTFYQVYWKYMKDTTGYYGSALVKCSGDRADYLNFQEKIKDRMS